MRTVLDGEGSRSVLARAVRAAPAVVLIALPALRPGSFLMRLATVTGIYVILSMSLNLLTGYTGLLSLGHAAFYAIGAYTSALLSLRFGLGYAVTAPAAALFAAVFGVLLGIPTLKLHGAYLAIVTLGFCEIVRITALNWMSLTRGPMGLPGIPSPSILGFEVNSDAGYYYLVLCLAVLTTGAINRIVNSRMGRALVAIREDEIAAQALGIRVFRYKVMAFTLSAFFAGLAGSFYAHYVTYIDPQSFTFDESIQILSMVLLGGMGSTAGPVLGAALLVAAPELLRFLQHYRMLIYGIVLAVMMLFRPRGILGGAKAGRGVGG